MKSGFVSTVAAAAIAALMTSSLPAHAGGGHDHGPQFGGVVREAHGVAYELVARPDKLTLYASDHGKPVSIQNATAEAVIYGGSGKTTARFEPAGDDHLSARGAFKVGVGTRAVVTVSMPGKPATKLTFKLK